MRRHSTHACLRDCFHVPFEGCARGRTSRITNNEGELPMQNVKKRDVSPSNRNMLTIREVAAELAVSEKSIRRWIKGGELPVWRCGRVVRVSRDALNTFLGKD